LLGDRFFLGPIETAKALGGICRQHHSIRQDVVPSARPVRRASR
jgi:hypothetical protein